EAQAVAVTPAGGKDVAGGEADAVLQRLVEQSVAVDRLWKFDPQHEPTRRAAHLCPARKAARDRRNHLVDILGKGSPDPPQVAVVAATGQKIGERCLQ